MSTDPISAANTAASASASASSSKTVDSALQSVNLDQFLKLMITQLQNQDPLNPSSSTDILNQLGQLRQISATDTMSTTLASLQLGQNLSTASSFIGKTIDGLGNSGNQVTGVVDKVSILNGTPSLFVGNDTVSLNNVSDVLPTATTSTSGN